ncbi:MAG: tetratricopeptide repeat protein [Calothrix sp. MO_167.B42]|nr:tetratricopeptide repeat protein [Calothrix sp. MO_167.B42]
MIDPITLTTLIGISKLALNLTRTLANAPKARDGFISLVSGKPASKKNNLQEEEIKYYKRKEKREQELKELQERIEQGKAERELGFLELQKKELELKKEEAEDRRKISALHRELLQEIQQKDIQIKLEEIQTNWEKDNWFSKLSRRETEQILQEYGQYLLILTSPLSIAKDNSLTSLRNLDFDLEMRTVGDFLEKYYSPQDQLHPLRFYSDYFQEPIGAIDLDRLHSVLAPIATYIFYTDIRVDAVTFRVGHWRLPDSKASKFPAIEWNWKEVKQELITQDKTEEEALEIIRKIIIETHKLLAAFCADLYFLSLNPYYEPKLCELKSEFGVDLLEPFIKEIDDMQQQVIESYENEIKNLIIEEEKPIYELGIEHFYQGEYQAAIEKFNRLIEINPNSADGYYSRGLSYANLGNFQKTIEDYIQLEKLNPEIKFYPYVFPIIEEKYPENTAFHILELAIISICCGFTKIVNDLIHESVKLYLRHLNYDKADEIKDDLNQAIDIIFNILMSEPQLYSKEYLEKLSDCLAEIGDIEASKKVNKALSLLEESF